jgi:hypothetical protein
MSLLRLITFRQQPEPAEPLWTPNEISTTLWLDASDATTITLNGSNVTQWADKKNNTINVNESFASFQPTYLTNQINGKAAIRFAPGGEGTRSRLRTTALVFNTNNLSVFTVFNRFSSTNTRHRYSRIVTFWNSGDNIGNPGDYATTRAWIAGFVGSNDTFAGIAPPNVVTYRNSNAITAQSYTFNQVTILGTTLSNTSVTFRKNGTQTSGTTSATAIDSNVINIGSSPAFVDSEMYGLIAEVIITSALTQQDQEKIEGYLAHKWGLTANLPAGHPYKTTPPYV